MHRLKHEGKRCFRCQICSATFTSFGEYKHHMRVSRHIIRKPRIYECKTCGAMFTNSGNLIVHLRSLNHEASELANYFQSRWGVWGCWPPSFTQISPGSETNFSLHCNTQSLMDRCPEFGCVDLLLRLWSILLHLQGNFNMSCSTPLFNISGLKKKAHFLFSQWWREKNSV